MKVEIKMIVETFRIESEGDLKRNIRNKIERTGNYRVEIVGMNKIPEFQGCKIPVEQLFGKPELKRSE